jgi:hypothetical protein
MTNAPARPSLSSHGEALRQLAGRASRKRPDCRWQPRNHTRTVPLTATQPHVDSVFVPRSVQQSRAEIGLTKLRRGVDECAGSEAVGYRPHYGKIKGTPPRGAKPLIRYGFPAGRRSVGSATRRQKARFLKALFGTSHTETPETPVSRDDNEFEILMGRIGNRDRRESFINEVLRAQRQAGVEPGSTTRRAVSPAAGC